jgi:hypothetical protein
MTQPKERTLFGTLLALAGVLLSVLFLLNPTFGVLEIPDNLPIVGNIDEVFASAVLFSCLGYLGVNVLPFLQRRGLKFPAATFSPEAK